MSEPDLSTLPNRMRYAADVMDEAKERLDSELSQTEVSFGSTWNSHALRRRARIWESQECEAAQQNLDVDALARDLTMFGPDVRANPRRGAQKLAESGWRKGKSND